MGTAGAAIACVLMAVINPNVTYWAFTFPSLLVSVLGSDLVYTAGTLYIAKISLAHEQSLAAAGFQTMGQVCFYSIPSKENIVNIECLFSQLGNSFGVTISTVVFNRVNESIVLGEDRLRSYQAAQWTNSAFGLCGCLVSLIFFWGVGSPGSRLDIEKQGTTHKSSNGNEKTESEAGAGPRKTLNDGISNL